MKPGPAPKPSHLRAVEGDHSHRPARPEPPDPGKGVPSCPTWLDREAKAEWKRVARRLHKAGMLSLVDRGVLASWCAAWSTFAAAQKLVQKEGPVVEGYRGGKVKNPAWQISRDAMVVMKGLASELGMSYAARARVGVGGVLPGDGDEGQDLDELLA